MGDSMFLRIKISALVFVATASWGSAGEVGAIKKFVRFPVDTFNLKGQISPTALEAATTPSPSQIAVDGWWPDKKLLLITFDGESYHVLYRSVEMNDQKTWDARLSAGGGLTCHTLRTGAVPTTTAGTKGFASPC
jgi:hypothetical protein